MASPTTEARTALVSLLVATFSAEGFPIRNDKLHPALGSKGPVAGVSPEAEPGGGEWDIGTRILVQVYGRWKENPVDPAEAVDPAPIEDWAWRFRQALRGAASPNPAHVWWFTLEEITYPDDPKGNKTRFEALVTARGPNAAVHETIA